MARVVAPPSPAANRRALVVRIKALRAKAASARTAAEAKELVDALVSLLPPGTLGP